MEQVLRNEGELWKKAPGCCFLVDGCCYFLVHAGWALLCLDGSGWLLIFSGGLWMVVDIFSVAHSHCMQRAESPPILQPVRGAHILAHCIPKIEGNIRYEVGLPKFVDISFVPL